MWQVSQNPENSDLRITHCSISNYKFSDFMVYILLYKTDVHSTNSNQRVCYADL